MSTGFKNKYDLSNEQLNLAFNFVEYTDANIFLTGKAGTGKTTFLHELKKTSNKRMIVTAPTGVAAINAGGVTIHSFFQLPFGPQVIEKKSDGSDIDGHKEINKFNKIKINIIKSLDLLVIDEISMVRADLLDAIDRVLRRFKNRHKPFGGVQLLMIGDLQQLAPVVKDDDWKILVKYYETPFFFCSQSLKKTNFISIELDKVFRQKDEKFVGLLNKIRDNNLDKESIDILNSRYIPNPDLDKNSESIVLTTHNFQSDKINNQQMNKIDAEGYIFRAEISGQFPEYSYPNDPYMLLKPGAQVMYVKNDASREKRYYNGKIGIITSIDDNIVYVKCKNDEEEIATEAIEWHNYSYTIDEKTEEIVETLLGTYKQIPLKPAWAITIHKSQGLTFDRAIIDASSAFAHGQVYVALSRCRSLEGIILSSKIDSNILKSDYSVNRFLKDIEKNKPDISLLNSYKAKFQASLIFELNDFSQLSNRLESFRKIIKENKSALIANDYEILDSMCEKFRIEITDISNKFNRQLSMLIKENIEVSDNKVLLERIAKASEYYYEKLILFKKDFFDKFYWESDNKQIKKVVLGIFDKVTESFNFKIKCTESSKNGFDVSRYLETRAKAMLVDKSQKATKLPEVKETDDSFVLRPDLYNQLKVWRNQKAEENKQTVYMVISRISMIEISNLLPDTLIKLKKIKGIGNKKAEQYGNEIIEIVKNFKNQ